MDNVTHTLAGFALARAGLRRLTPGATVALVLGSNLPDVDLVTRLQGMAAYLQHHRDVSHSVFGAPVLALALAALLRWRVKGSRFLHLLLCSLVGIAGHVFMDLWTSYGTRVLAPFDRTWHTWDLVFIIDPYVWLLLLASILLPRWLPDSGVRIATVGLGLVLSYIGWRAVLHTRALEEALIRVPSHPVVRAAVLPSPFDPFRWRVLADTGSAYWTGEVNLRGPSPPLLRRDKLPESAVVARAREGSELASLFLDFSRFPWLQVEPAADGTAVIWKDLRFEEIPAVQWRGMEERRRTAFTTRVVVGRDGEIRSETLRF